MEKSIRPTGPVSDAPTTHRYFVNTSTQGFHLEVTSRVLKNSVGPWKLVTKRLAPCSMVGSWAQFRRFVQDFPDVKQLLSTLGPTWDARTAIRVTFRSLHHPAPDNIAEYPARDFSSFEGQVRWVGPPRSFDENEYTDATFIASLLQCEPYYTDWSSVDLLNVTGAGIVPSSIYDVQVVAASCDGFEDICTAKSETLTIETARWGDLVAPFQEPGGPPGTASQPDVRDLAAVVTVLVLPVPSVPFVRAKLQGSRPDSATKINVLEITFVIDAVKSRNYPYAGPTDCP